MKGLGKRKYFIADGEAEGPDHFEAAITSADAAIAEAREETA